MTISAGTYTVGGVGTDYPGITGLDDALNDIEHVVTGMTGNITFDIRGDVTLTLVSKHIFFQGYTLTITSTTNYHGGNPLIGFVVTVNTGFVIANAHYAIPNGTVVLDSLQFKNYSFEISEPDDLGLGIRLNSVVKNCIFNKCDLQITHTTAGLCQIYDNVLFSLELLHEADGTCVIENNTCKTSLVRGIGFVPYNGVSANYDNFTLRNNFSYAFDVVNPPSQSHMPITYNCASQDTSAATIGWRSGSSGNVGSIVLANEFKSVTETDPTFLFLKNNAVGVLAANGIVPTYAKKDIAGYDIPWVDNYPIGSHVSLMSASRKNRIISVF
jgi:hypothetical protein